MMEIVILGNSVKQYLMASGALVGFLLGFKIFQVIVIARLKKAAAKTKTDVDDALIEVISGIQSSLYLILAVFLATRLLVINGFVNGALTTLLLFVVIRELSRVVKTLMTSVVMGKILAKDDVSARAGVALATKLIEIGLWIMGILFLLSNQGIDVSSLLAGLGIGGIAIALAAQNVLGDLLSSFTIVFDKPFGTGDFIEIGTVKGRVEKVGIKTTRIRSNQGEIVVVPNTKLTSSQIKNYAQMKERRNSFEIGVTYDTGAEQLKQIPKMIEEIINANDKLRLDRVHFKSFGDWALIFEIVYFVKSDDYKLFMDMQEEVNYAIRERLEKEKITMAFPSQSIYLRKL